MAQTHDTPFHVALTGHRPSKLAGYDLSHPFYAALQQRLEGIIADGLRVHDQLVLHSGMALGADTVWSMAIIAMRAQHPDRIRFVAEVPVMSQSDHWPSKVDRDRWLQHLQMADDVRVYAPAYTVGCLWDRNRGMIDASQLLLAIHDGGTGGGTSGAIDYARSKHVQVFVIHPKTIR